MAILSGSSTIRMSHPRKTCFTLSDAHVAGFPVLYANPSFLTTYGYRAANCTDKHSAELVQGVNIATGTRSYVLELASTLGMTHETTEAALARLKDAANDEYKALALNWTHKSYFVNLTCTKSGAALFVSEVITLFLKHPVIGWTYVLSLQRDITDDISVESLLCAAAAGRHKELIRNHEITAKQQVSTWDTDAESAVKYFHEKAGKILRKKVMTTMVKDPHVQGFSQTMSTSSGLSRLSDSSGSKSAAQHFGGGLFHGMLQEEQPMFVDLPEDPPGFEAVPGIPATTLSQGPPAARPASRAENPRAPEAKVASTTKENRKGRVQAKKILCRWYMGSGCHSGHNCRFAHGIDDLASEKSTKLQPTFAPDPAPTPEPVQPAYAQRGDTARGMLAAQHQDAQVAPPGLTALAPSMWPGLSPAPPAWPGMAVAAEAEPRPGPSPGPPGQEAAVDNLFRGIHAVYQELDQLRRDVASLGQQAEHYHGGAQLPAHHQSSLPTHQQFATLSDYLTVAAAASATAIATIEKWGHPDQ
mmetsp:Transcript_25251/g.71196  ORF Transcript_25251/g.71196 Transcript_25251/m.71196 type:complete len:530 (-) Transcript_25251:114-1703(-)|eukprot:CAMPEP_0179250220 /NCGR_PEP_ID=MMETSP0797-20121207/21052_1 /TAXON_ID=47934 /ORGANISM="Dinophysis acuminata, Strain DAEP01" /LENGTH=529 /DNA_ID=CAMNT_0020957943 /DNA_START=69 /DNA_END=1658 /DNA_ORIENTATION=-